MMLTRNSALKHLMLRQSSQCMTKHELSARNAILDSNKLKLDEVKHACRHALLHLLEFNSLMVTLVHSSIECINTIEEVLNLS